MVLVMFLAMALVMALVVVLVMVLVTVFVAVLAMVLVMVLVMFLAWSCQWSWCWDSVLCMILVCTCPCQDHGNDVDLVWVIVLGMVHYGPGTWCSNALGLRVAMALAWH